MSGQDSDDSVVSLQPPDEELAFPDLKPGDAWGESITRRRADQLEAILRASEAEKEHGERSRTFHETMLTGADVFWISSRVMAKVSVVQAVAVQAVYLIEARELGSFLREVRLDDLHLEDAFFSAVNEVHMEGAILVGAHMEGATFQGGHLNGADLSEAHLMGTILYGAQLQDAYLIAARLTEAYLEGAHLEGAHLEGAFLVDAELEGAHLEGANLRAAHLEGAHLGLAFLDSATALDNVVLGNEKSGYVSLADVRWGDVNLAVVDWTRTTHGFLGLRRRIEAIELGDERKAYTAKDNDGKPKDTARRLQEYRDAVRANRQLATVLRSQGLNEDADRFAYKAQKLQRQVLRRQRRYGAALGSWLLDVVAGYGYKPMRTLTVYLLAIITFAIAYFALGQTVGPHLSPLGAVVFSMTSFHGRGFFPGGIVLDDPITVLAAFEAFIGLVIEVSFIATFTQRFFAR